MNVGDEVELSIYDKMVLAGESGEMPGEHSNNPSIHTPSLNNPAIDDPPIKRKRKTHTANARGDNGGFKHDSDDADDAKPPAKLRKIPAKRGRKKREGSPKGTVYFDDLRPEDQERLLKIARYEIVAKGGTLARVEFGGQVFTVGHTIKLLRPIARFGILADTKVLPHSAGAPPVLPEKPETNTSVTKIPCGIARDSTIHKIWRTQTPIKTTLRAGTTVYLNAYYKDGVPSGMIIDAFGSNLKPEDVWWCDGFSSKKFRDQVVSAALHDLATWKEAQQKAYDLAFKKFIAERLNWEWNLVKELKETGAPVAWPDEGEATLAGIAKETGPGSVYWKWLLERDAEDILAKLNMEGLLNEQENDE